MRKASILLAVVLMLSLIGICGEYLMNNTGETIAGLRLIFSEPVTITGFGDILMTVEPLNESTEFVFSGGGVDTWGGHWVSWEPVSAVLVSHEWLATQSLLRADAYVGAPQLLIGLPNDPDGDGLSDDLEESVGTDPHHWDTDGDGLSDYTEVTKYLTDPLKEDSDGDGILDSDWKERREYTYTVRFQGEVYRPFDTPTMSNHWQDLVACAVNGDRLAYELILYPNAHALLNPAPYPRVDLPQDFLEEFTRPTTLFNYNDAMQSFLSELVRGCSSDYEVVETIHRWQLENFEWSDLQPQPNTGSGLALPNICFTIRPGKIEKRELASSKHCMHAYEAGWTDEQMIDEVMLGESMFRNRRHGTCTSSSILMATMLRAVGIPTRIVSTVGLADLRNPGHERFVERLPLSVLAEFGDESFDGGGHRFAEALIGNQWVGVEAYQFPDRNWEAALVPFIVIGAYRDFESTDFGLLAATWGDKYSNPQHNNASHPIWDTQEGRDWKAGLRGDIEIPPFDPVSLSYQLPTHTAAATLPSGIRTIGKLDQEIVSAGCTGRVGFTGDGDISWVGPLIAGEAKEITVRVYNEDYITSAGQVSTVRFAVRFDASSGWGAVIQGIPESRKKLWKNMFGSPFEEVELVVVESNGTWSGSLVIVPQVSVESMYVLHPPTENTPFFAVEVNIAP